jgi:hypothetical protein
VKKLITLVATLSMMLLLTTGVFADLVGPDDSGSSSQSDTTENSINVPSIGGGSGNSISSEFYLTKSKSTKQFLEQDVKVELIDVNEDSAKVAISRINSQVPGIVKTIEEGDSINFYGTGKLKLKQTYRIFTSTEVMAAFFIIS